MITWRMPKPDRMEGLETAILARLGIADPYAGRVTKRQPRTDP